MKGPFEAVTKENPRTYQKNVHIEETFRILLAKFLMLFIYWSNQMENLLAAVVIYLFT